MKLGQLIVYDKRYILYQKMKKEASSSSFFIFQKIKGSEVMKSGLNNLVSIYFNSYHLGIQYKQYL